MVDKLVPYLHSVKEFSAWVNGNRKWVQFYPYDTWTHPIFSDTTIDPNVAADFVKNFNNNVMGRDLVTEYDHGLDKAKGGKAAGKVVKVITADKGQPLGDGQIANEAGLWGLVEFNDIAKTEIDNGEWSYWSASHYDSWTHPQTGETFNHVLENPSLTNRPYVRGMVPLNHSDIVIDPVHVEEHQDELTPETLKWIRQQMASSSSIVNNDNGEEEGEEVNPDEILAALRTTLGIDDTINIVDHVAGMNDELGPLRELKKEHSEAKKFSELFPEQAEELAEARRYRQENAAKEFSEQFVTARVNRTVGAGDEAKQEPTSLGFSGLVIEEIGKLAKSFSDGTANAEGFKSVLDAVLNNGIVDYGTKGSSREIEHEEPINLNKTDSREVRKAFSDKVSEIVASDNLEYEAAYAQAAVKYPELFQAYKTIKPHVSSAS